MDSVQLLLLRALRDDFSRASSLNTRYSLRAFSRRLGISVSVCSDFLNEKRRLSRATIRKIIGSIPLDLCDRTKVLKYLNEKKGAPSIPDSDSSLEFETISHEVFHLVSEWQVLATRSLFDLPGFPATAEGVSEYLGISRALSEKALSTLQSLELIRSHKGKLRAIPGKSFTTTADIPSPWIQKKHAQNIELAKNALVDQPVEVRDFSSMVMATSPEMIRHAKERLREFRRELCAELESIPSRQKTELFQLNLQFFRLTQPTTSRRSRS